MPDLSFKPFGEGSSGWQRSTGRGLISATTVGQVILLTAAFWMQSRTVWVLALALVAAVSFAAWIHSYLRTREIQDIPRSRIASAAQGYVELVGTAMPVEGHLVYAPPGRVPCCWYRLMRGDNSEHVEMSDSSFWLVDSTGHIVVDPEGAEIIPSRILVIRDGDHRYRLEIIYPKDQVYVLGEHRSVHPPSPRESIENEVGEILVRWKQDRKELLARFDANGDGELDIGEWETARRAARELVEERLAREAKPGPAEPLNIVARPRDGRDFLIASLSREALTRRFGRWTWVQIGIVLIAASAAWWFSQTQNRVLKNNLFGRYEYERPVLGIEAYDEVHQRTTQRLGVKGAAVLRVASGVPLESGDVIVAVDGQPVESVAQLLSRIDEHKVGDTVRLRVHRNGKETEIATTLRAGR